MHIAKHSCNKWYFLLAISIPHKISGNSDEALLPLVPLPIAEAAHGLGPKLKDF